MNAGVRAFFAFIVSLFAAMPAVAAVRVYSNHCCNDGPGDCSPGSAGAKAYATAWAEYHQARDQWPSTDFIQEQGEQHGCYQFCECSISEYRLWSFEFDSLSLSEPHVRFKRTVYWTDCSLSV